MFLTPDFSLPHSLPASSADEESAEVVGSGYHGLPVDAYVQTQIHKKRSQAQHQGKKCINVLFINLSLGLIYSNVAFAPFLLIC